MLPSLIGALSYTPCMEVSKHITSQGEKRPRRAASVFAHVYILRKIYVNIEMWVFLLPLGFFKGWEILKEKLPKDALLGIVQCVAFWTNLEENQIKHLHELFLL